MASTTAWGWASAAVAAIVVMAACSAGGGGEPILVGSATVGAGGGGVGGASDCSEQPCKLVPPQCGCLDGERCTLAGSPLTRACLPAGDKNLTESCGECVAGAMCIDNGSGAPPLCHQFCDTDMNCGAGAICILDIGAGLGKLCTHACDPIAKTGCADPATKCDILQESGGGRWYTMCVGVGAGPHGQACTASSLCAAGLGCVEVVGMMIDKKCVEWCDVNNPICPTGTCEPFMEPIMIGAIEYGVCIP